MMVNSSRQRRGTRQSIVAATSRNASVNRRGNVAERVSQSSRQRRGTRQSIVAATSRNASVNRRVAGCSRRIWLRTNPADSSRTLEQRIPYDLKLVSAYRYPYGGAFGVTGSLH